MQRDRSRSPVVPRSHPLSQQSALDRFLELLDVSEEFRLDFVAEIQRRRQAGEIHDPVWAPSVAPTCPCTSR